MVDGVNFNPFAQRAFNAEEIEKCDTNKDGVISYEEMEANASWLSTVAGVDDEGEVQIGEDDSSSQANAPQAAETEPAVVLSDNELKIYGAAVSNGVQSSADNAEQLQQYMNTVIDSYIEQYMQNNPDLEQNQKSSLIAFIKTTGQQFITNYTQNNTTVPYDTQAVAQSLIQTLDSAVQQRNESAAAVNSQLDDYKNNVESNYEQLSATTNAADDDYVTSAEFQQMKEQAIAYLMGTLLNGAEDSEFLTALNPSYKSNANYKIAMAAINSINSETDPAKIQEYLQQAKTALSNLIGTQNTDGTSQLNNAVLTKDSAIEKAETAEAKAGYTETLTDLVDSMIEAYSNERIRGKNLAHSEDEVALYESQLKAYMTEFINQYEGDGENLEAEFKQYVQNIQNELNQVNAELDYLDRNDSNLKYGTRDVYNELLDSINDAGTYVSEEEKEEIIANAADLFLKAMHTGEEDTALYEIYPNYQTDTNYVSALQLYQGLNTSVHPAEDLAKIKELLTTMLNNRGVDNIINGVETQERKNINLEPGGAWLNGILGYNTDNTTSGDSINYFCFTTDQDGNIKWTNNGDRANNETIMNQLSERIHEKMKEQLGDMYDEDTINEYFKTALKEALVSLGDLSDCIEVSDVVNMIVIKFNEVATNGLKGKKSNEFSRTEVIVDSGVAKEYSEATIVTTALSKNIQKNRAKTQLEKMRASLIEQAKKVLGDNFNNSDINILIDDSINETVDAYKFGRRGFWSYFNCNTLYNNFLDTFENKLDDYKESKE